MVTRPFLMHALSPLHVGTGHAADIVDLPIARQRATNIPYVPGSAIKGVMREDRRAELKALGVWEAVFGPDRIDGAEDAHAGALVAGDAWLLALPVRSFRGTFAWATSPLLLQLARRDVPALPAAAAPAVGGALVSDDTILHNGKLYLEDLDLPAKPDEQVTALATWLAGKVWATEPEVMVKRLAVVDDEVMTFLLETATQLDTRVRIDNDTRTVAEGALWIEESLPPESLLVGLLAAERSRDGSNLTPQQVLDHALPVEKRWPAQFGGKATVGRGRCELIAIQGNRA